MRKTPIKNSFVHRTVRRQLSAIAMPFGLVAQAQTLPTKPIQFIVPFPAGGTAGMARALLAEKMGP
ncbi:MULTISPECIES: hypothetical protein [Rhodanobacter]|uniref:hypothetical protein n=1 Tax=Rhodanobacter TaxID=75309 RepID=UPI0006888AE5|nr:MULTISPECIES: hypothetical protein [Rhodanobacter]UJJ53426.1 hypothetical protein LRK53_10520 [Rhodanobacter thiooxydans]